MNRMQGGSARVHARGVIERYAMVWYESLRPAVADSPRSKGSAPLIIGMALAIAPWVAVAIISAMAAPHRGSIPVSAMQEDHGLSWRAQVTPRTARGAFHGLLFEFPSDHSGNTTSELRLFEDGVELGPRRTAHRDIRELGSGRYSHWQRNIHFSTTDGSDPRTNGRIYEFESPVTLSRGAMLGAALLSLAGTAMAWWSPPIRRRTASWRERWLTGSLRSPLISPWRPVPLPRAWRWALIAIWLACASYAAWIGRGEHDPYLLSTVPTVGYGDHTNALPGYAAMIDGEPRHGENMQTWDHVAMFNGSIIAADMYANRPLYPFLVSCLAWAFGVAGASLVVNLMGWAVGAWACVRIGAELAGRWEAGVVSGLLACLGAGWWFHIGDYSAHLLSFTTSSLTLLMLLRSRVWAERQPAEVHAAIAATLVVASLTYNSGLFFAAAYFLLAVWRNRWWHVLAVVLAAVLMQRLWPLLLNTLSNGNFDYYRVERGLLQQALAEWPHFWRDGSAIGRAIDIAIDSFVHALPLLPLLVLGVLAPLLGGLRRDAGACGADARPERGAIALMIIVSLLPTLALVVYSPTATARGYLVFCASGAIFAIAGLLFARLRPGAWRGAGAGLLLFALSVQAIMVTRHAEGDARAVKLFLWGLPQWSASIIDELGRSPRTEVIGLCGEPSPRIGGGTASLIECGAFDGGEPRKDLPAFKNPVQLGQMIVVRGVMILAIGTSVVLLLRSGIIRWRGAEGRPPPLVLLGLLLLALLLVPPVAARVRGSGPESNHHTIHDRRLPTRAKEIVQIIELDPLALLRLEQVLVDAAGGGGADATVGSETPRSFPQADLAIDILTGLGWSKEPGEGVRIDIVAGGETIATLDTEGTGRTRRVIDASRLIAALKRDPVLQIVARRDGGIVQAGSWQRGDLPGRSLILDGVPVPPARDLAMPLVELRVIPRDRNYLPRLLLY